MADGPEFVPENVKQFLTHFRGYVKDNNVPGILSMYETQWPQLTEKYYLDRSAQHSFVMHTARP